MPWTASTFQNRVIVLAALTIALTGCAQNFRPGPGMTPTDLSMAKGRCGTASRDHASGFAAAGRTRDVAIAAGISLLLDAARTSSDYNDCMLAMGAVPDDGKAQPLPTSYAQAPVPVTQEPISQPSPAVMLATADLPTGSPAATYRPVSYTAQRSPGTLYAPELARAIVAQRAMDRADSWMKAQSMLKPANQKSRDLYLVLCGGGDDSSCIMASALARR